jgi:eukaryotic-like serine/threonine-protein kinase
MKVTNGRTALFGPYRMDLHSAELRKFGKKVRMGEQPFQILFMLLENPGEMVTREALRSKLWLSDTFVDFDHGLNSAIQRLRDCLSDTAEKPLWVETIPRRGYRFVGQVEWTNGAGGSPPNGETAALPPEMRPSAQIKVAEQDHERTGDRFILPAPSSVQMPPGVNGTGVRPKSAEKATRSSWAAIIGAAVVIAGLAASGWWFFSLKTNLLTEKDTIVLADFLNTSGDMVFDGTLRQGLSVQLEQSPFLRILSDQQIQQTLQMMGQKRDAKLTPGIARELCQRTGSAAVLDGSIAQIGSRYLLTLKAVNCSNGELLSSAEAQASDKSHVLDALGKTASEIRNKLGESLTTVQKFDTPLVQATTSSLEALKAFSSCARSGGVIDELPMLQRAIELDPNFAAVYGQMADYYSSLGEAERASEYAQKAFDRRERVSERERLAITATYYFSTLGDLDQELRTWPILEQMYPRDWGPWNNSSSSRRSLGDYDRALRDAQEALRLASDQSNTYLNVGQALLSLNRTDEVKQIVQRALTRGLDVPVLHLLLYQVAFLESDAKEMEAQLAALTGRDTPEALFAQSSTEAYFGRRRNSRGFSRQVVEMARRLNFNELGAQVQDADALREAEFGNPGQAIKAATTALTLSSGRRAKVFSSLALARAGDTTRAQALANELSSQFSSDTLLQRYWLPTIRGSIELARQSPAKAIDALQSVSYELGDVGFSAGNGNLYPVYIRGLAYLETHQGKEAAAEFQKFLDHRSIVLNSPLGALAHLGLARAYSLQGDSAKARECYENFLALWKHADRDVPILKQAKAEYAKLQRRNTQESNNSN